MNRTNAAKFIAYTTCLFLTPFFLAAYFDPLSYLSVESIGLLPTGEDPTVGLSNIRGTVGGVRLGIIAMIAIGAYQQRRDMCLAAAILVGAIAAGRFISLPFDGWNLVSFGTASAEVVIVAAMLYLAKISGRES